MVIVSTRRYGTHRITTVPTKPGTPITTGKNPITTQVTLKPTTAKVSTTRVGARNTPIIKRTVQQTQKMRSQMISQMPRNPPPPIKPQIPGQKTIIKTSKISGPRSNHRQHKLNPQINTVGSLLKNFGNTQMAYAMSGPKDGTREKKPGWWSNYNSTANTISNQGNMSGYWTPTPNENKLDANAIIDDPPPPPKIDTPIGSGVGSGARIISEQEAKKTGTFTDPIIDTNLDPFKTNQVYDIRMDKERLEKIYKQQRENNKKNPPTRHTYIQHFDLLMENDFKSFNNKNLPVADLANFLSGYNTGKKVDKESTAYTMNKATNKLELIPGATRKVYKKTYTADEAMNLANPEISYNFDSYKRMYTNPPPRQNEWYI